MSLLLTRQHGKTTLLDRIRGTAVAAKEAGGITQAVGCTIIPLETVKKACGKLLEKFKVSVEIPGLLLLDSPGHEAFTSIRKRGSSIADLAILVIDLNEGFQPQTDESLHFLKEFKTPFMVAATKLDKIMGWRSSKENFLESFSKQNEATKDDLEKKVYRIVQQLSERGFDSERFDRVADFKKNVAIVPCSGVTGEGVPELLMMLLGLSQQFLKKELESSGGPGKGSILEVKEVRGLGVTADVILYDGEIKRGDWLIVGGKEPIVAKIKALLQPHPLKELRVEKEFENVDKVSAASGVKISAPGLENAIAGSPIMSVSSERDVENTKELLQKDVEEIRFETAAEGAIVRADTLGSLEALVKILKEKNIEIRKGDVGPATRKDVMELETLSDNKKRVLFAFNVPVSQDVTLGAKDRNVKVIQNNVIYRLFDEYGAWTAEEERKKSEQKLAEITMPAKIRLLPGFVFRASKPAIIGVEVLGGELRKGTVLLKNKAEVGSVREIQSEGASVEGAKKGQRVAVSIEGPTIGRQIEEGDELVVSVTKNDLRVLEELKMEEEAKLAREVLSV